MCPLFNPAYAYFFAQAPIDDSQESLCASFSQLNINEVNEIDKVDNEVNKEVNNEVDKLSSAFLNLDEIAFNSISSDEDSLDLNVIETFVHALNNANPNADEFYFNFENQGYAIQKEWRNGARSLVLKNDQQSESAPIAGSKLSLEELASKSYLISLFSKLTIEAKEAFLPLFELEDIGHINADAPIVSADLDGSSIRQVVLGIQAGVIDISSGGIALLAELLNSEAQALLFLNRQYHEDHDQTLKAYQEDGFVRSDLEELTRHLKYKSGHTLLVSIGDGAHDRLSCNKDADREIREKMHEQGVIYILGNHDVFYQKYIGGGYRNNFPFLASQGCFGKDSATPQEWQAHQEKIFVNGAYRPETNTLYVHHGLEIQENKIVTAFGEFPISIDDVHFSLEKFVNWINEQLLPLPKLLCSEENFVQNTEYLNRLINFRPSEEKNQEAAKALGVGILHGHNGVMNRLLENVIVLNSRSAVNDEWKYFPMAARVGNFYVSPTPVNANLLRD